MKRRSFLAALFAAPMVPVSAKAAAEKLSIDAAPMRVSERADGLPIVYEDGILKLPAANLGTVTPPLQFTIDKAEMQRMVEQAVRDGQKRRTIR